MSKTANWAARTKSAANAVPAGKSGKGRGKRYEGTVKNGTLKAYKTGSFGVEMQYTINVDGNERTVYENVVLKKLTQDGVLEPTKYGAETLKRRLLAFGLSADEINGLGIPATPNVEFNLTPIIGAGVAVYCRDAEYMGKPKLEVASVYPLDGNFGQASA
jgi:hypothetical protein